MLDRGELIMSGRDWVANENAGILSQYTCSDVLFLSEVRFLMTRRQLCRPRLACVWSAVCGGVLLSSFALVQLHTVVDSSLFFAH